MKRTMSTLFSIAIVNRDDIEEEIQLYTFRLCNLPYTATSVDLFRQILS
jgi:hypothetical protein